MLGSQGLVLATAMVVSSTVLFIAFSRQKTFFFQEEPRPNPTTPRSCLSSGDRKKKERKRKKRVQFAENVKEPSGNGKEFRNQQKRGERNCGNQVQGIPRNRITGILKDRLQRLQLECSC